MDGWDVMPASQRQAEAWSAADKSTELTVGRRFKAQLTSAPTVVSGLILGEWSDGRSGCKGTKDVTGLVRYLHRRRSGPHQLAAQCFNNMGNLSV